MLDAVGVASVEELFEHIPNGLRPTRPIALPAGCSEDEVLGRLTRMAGRNRTDAVCFAGGGAYDHYVPTVVGAIVSRGELLTSYTPYQPEVSQGMLQALFEYQTAVCELTGLPVANASLYEGASAVAEGASLACAATRRGKVVLSGGVDAPSAQVLRTYVNPRGWSVETTPVDPRSGRSRVAGLDDATGALVVQQPNALGVVEDVRSHAEAAHAVGAKLVVKLDPTTVGVLATPGRLGADVVVGEGQGLGQGLGYGGPTFGFLACTADQVRRLPGRVVGETVDARGRRGYVMTLRAREQDIRRERATSNICTNQTLNAVAASVYLAWLGPRGLVELGRACLSRAHAAARRLTRIDGVELAVEGPFLKEFPLRLDVADPGAAVGALHDAGYLVGPVVPDGPAAGAVLVALTERRTAVQVEGLARALDDVVSSHPPGGAGRPALAGERG
ncbi:MAG: aminomethyl-transferring glycine dehydrogenase subunit GcvPA [Actinobacteria bacterium]|nr:aminomethyl-transferring glycine dehydrogenase subunit GcvPA [Actinomycetota bacterium]